MGSRMEYSKNISFSRMVTVFEFITGHVAQCLGSAKGPRFNTAQEGKKSHILNRVVGKSF